MTERIFDQSFLDRLARTLRALEQEELDANDPHPLEPEDYEAIYSAYADSGGDPVSAKEQIGVARERRDQALGRIVQFVSDQYGFGPIERLDDRELSVVTRDASDAAARWMEDVEMHHGPTTQPSPLRILLKSHYQLSETMLDMHDAILWPLAKRISPEE